MYARDAAIDLIRLKSETLKGFIRPHLNFAYRLYVRCFWSWCALIFFQFLLKNDPPRPAPARPGPTDEKMKKKKPSFPWRLVKKIDLKNFTQKFVDSSRKNVKKIGQFYVTLICSLNLRNNRMILFVKTSKNGPFLFWRIFEIFDTIWLIGRLIVRVILSIKFEGRDANDGNI